MVQKFWHSYVITGGNRLKNKGLRHDKCDRNERTQKFDRGIFGTDTLLMIISPILSFLLYKNTMTSEPGYYQCGDIRHVRPPFQCLVNLLHLPQRTCMTLPRMTSAKLGMFAVVVVN
uniref:Uncharacterized protein n=1 Tax=Klebsiella pneumoniae TaxID=573 RepID=A0A8B0SSZ1_KLEPN|nr:hypothetical protein [Klebsiella pneumoniae]